MKNVFFLLAFIGSCSAFASEKPLCRATVATTERIFLEANTELTFESVGLGRAAEVLKQLDDAVCEVDFASVVRATQAAKSDSALRNIALLKLENEVGEIVKQKRIQGTCGKGCGNIGTLE